MRIKTKLFTEFHQIALSPLNMDAHTFLKLGNTYTKSVLSRPKVALRRFKSHFGVTLEVCSIVWNEIRNSAPVGALPTHLLWCLSFLKEYTTEHNRRSVFNADEKTMREWTWAFVKLISEMNVLSCNMTFFYSCIRFFTMTSSSDPLGEQVRWSLCRSDMFCLT